MPDNVKLDALDHPKTLDFAARLQVELPTAIGHLELLWAFTGKKAPQGNIGKWPDGAIARACCWMGSPETFMNALVLSGFVEINDKYRYVIHDWPEHAPRWVKSKLKTLNLTFIHTSGHIAPDTSGDTSDDTSRDSKGREVKGSEGKLPRAPIGARVWFLNFWQAYPKKKSKGDAEKAWKAIKPDEQLHDRIMNALERAKTSAEWRKEGGQFIPYPATWLRAKGWEDEDTSLPEKRAAPILCVNCGEPYRVRLAGNPYCLPCYDKRVS